MCAADDDEAVLQRLEYMLSELAKAQQAVHEPLLSAATASMK
jgi:hypothetical protein